MTTITTDYFIHNFKEVITTVENGEEIILQDGKKTKIKLSPIIKKKKTQVQKLVEKLELAIKKGNLKPSTYKNNKQMYNDFYSNLNL